MSIATWTAADMDFFNAVVIPAWDRATTADPLLRLFLTNPTDDTLGFLLARAVEVQAGEHDLDNLPPPVQVVILTGAVMAARVKWHAEAMNDTTDMLEEAIYEAGWLDIFEEADRMAVQ